jgi:hypothetical protein
VTLLYVLVALALGLIIGAVERASIINELHKVSAELHARIAQLETSLKEKP